MANTIYDIDIRYNILGTSQITNNFNILSQSAGKAERSMLSLGGALRGLGVAFGIGAIFQQAKKHFIDFNSELQQTQIGMATMIEAIFDTSHKQSMELAEKTRDELARFSRHAPGGMEDYWKGFTTLSTGLRNAKVTLNEMVGMSERLTAASQIKGLGGNVLLAQLNRSFLAEKGVRTTTAELIKFLSVGGVSLNAYKAMSLEKRAKTADQIAQSSAMRNALAEQGDSWSAITKSFGNSLDYALGKVGLPLFKAISKEIIAWNKWFDNNEAKINKWANSFSDELMKGFNIVKDVFQLIVDHKDTILMLGKAFVAYKLMGGAGSAFGGFGAKAEGSALERMGGIGGAIKSVLQGAGGGYILSQMLAPEAGALSTTIHTVLGGLGMLPGPLGLLANAVQAVTLTFQSVMSNLEKGQMNVFAHKDFVGRMRTATGYYQQSGIDDNRTYSLAAQLVREAKLDTMKEGSSEYLQTLKQAAHGNDNAYQMLIDTLKRMKSTDDKNSETKQSKPSLNTSPINVAVKMEVVSNDPDRFAIQFIDTIQSEVEQAARSRRGRGSGL